MKTYRSVKYILVASVALLLFACSTDDSIWVEDGKEVAVSFRPTIDNSMASRAIGDAGSIDELIVGVYNEEKNHLYSTEMDWTTAKSQGISLTLIEGRTYHILFWAQDGENTAYTFTNKGIEVNYDDYKNGGFDKMEQMDAFYGTASVTVGSQKVENKGEITLTRPLAQINFADDTTQPVDGTHQAVITFHGYPTSFNPFDGTVELNQTDMTFTFKDFPSESLEVEGSTYYYISSNYLFTSQEGTDKINVTLDLQNMDGTSIKIVELQNVTLENNKKTNVLGAMVQEPETWSVWDGTSKTSPTTDEQDRYVIDNAADIAWLGENASSLEADKTFIVTKDIDMARISGLSSINLPAGSTFDGQEHTIKGIRLGGALLGDATNLKIQNLTIEDAIINSTSSHAGVLVNTLKGNSTFSNVVITNSSVTTTNGAAGGMVGYISRKNVKDRSETLGISFNDCDLNTVSVEGTASEGKFVGLLSGYDNNESLSFDADCEATDVSVKDFTSVYTKANNSAWITDDVTNKYDGWLGHETYRRAKVTFGGVRMVPRWDGTTVTAKADLLLHNGESNYEVHSPFDLAGVRNATASPAALYLKENVDMFGQGADGEYNVPSNWTQSANVSEDDKYFMSFSTIPYLDGNDYGIYNLNINTQKVSTSLYYGGFIQSTTGTTTHKNIKFYNSCVVVPLVVYKNEDKGSAGMLVSNIAGDSYTMNNVHTYGCKIFALQKVGGIAARIAATTSSISNCSVNDCFIENYKCEGNKEKFEKSISSLNVSVTANFYSYGEVGGMFGFVENFTTIENCHVKKTTVYAFGQNDVEADMKGSGFLGTLAVAAAKGLGYFLVPGRHVSTFIGDICTSDDQGDEINITNCTVDSNTKCTNRWDKHNNTYTSIGQAYYIEFKDTKGSVKVDNNALTLANGNKNTKR